VSSWTGLPILNSTRSSHPSSIPFLFLWLLSLNPTSAKPQNSPSYSYISLSLDWSFYPELKHVSLILHRYLSYSFGFYPSTRPLLNLKTVLPIHIYHCPSTGLSILNSNTFH
ncbi:hypothetical protein SK128_008089, partial [Halocaridina rubra]